MQTPHQTAFPSKLCATLGVRGDCAWTKPGPFLIFPVHRLFLLDRWRREAVMPLKTIGTIAIPDAARSAFDHGAFDARSRRVFIAHTARDCLEVIDNGKHIATLPGFPGAAAAGAPDGHGLVTKPAPAPHLLPPRSHPSNPA